MIGRFVGGLGLASGLSAVIFNHNVAHAAPASSVTNKENRKVVIAVDHSSDSEHAVHWALGNMLRKGDNVVLLHVQSPADAMSGPGVYAAFTDTTLPPEAVSDFNKELARKEAEAVQKLMKKFVKSCEESKIACNLQVVKDQDARERICTEVEKLDADALVMGSRGMGPVKRMLLGSVSDYAVNNCNCPVVVVRRKNSSS